MWEECRDLTIVKLPDSEKEYTESSINDFSEDKLTKEFEKDDNRVLIVANKYQTGFDQPKLCAMYVLKKLRGVNAVQTFSRLNRIFPPFEKKTFILDFINKYEDIVKAFEPYYTTTLLANSVTPSAVYDLEARLDGYKNINLLATLIYVISLTQTLFGLSCLKSRFKRFLNFFCSCLLRLVWYKRSAFFVALYKHPQNTFHIASISCSYVFILMHFQSLLKYHFGIV